MTAEIAILNRSAVALAADSAVTVGKEKVWKNTNKLFLLSSFNDIGVMIFGSGDFCGISWEIVIKQFRKSIGKKVFGKLTECSQAFIDYLGKFETPGEDISKLNTYYLFIKSIRECEEKIEDSAKALHKRRQYTDAIDKARKNAEDLPIVFHNLSREAFSKSFSKTIRRFLSEMTKIHITNKILSEMITLCYERTRRQYLSSFQTGVVFAGYGEKEILPCIEHWIVDGKYSGQARSWKRESHNLGDPDAPVGIVIPFAQSDIAYLFMEGMQLDYLKFIEKTLEGVLAVKSDRLIDDYVEQKDRTVESARQKTDNKVVVRKFMDEFKEMRKDEVIKPMLNVVASLPKEEMAGMAEALVEITSLRRKIDSKIESVGGPVDVAVISKSDGFVWIKRKHYFDMDLNRDFMVRRQRRFEGDEQ